MHIGKLSLCGGIAGAVNGLLGAGGGTLLVPMLGRCDALSEDEVFPASVAIILPLSLISLFVSGLQAPLPWRQALAYLLGALPGGLLAGLFGKRIQVKWLHRVLGAVILVGGVRYLC